MILFWFINFVQLLLIHNGTLKMKTSELNERAKCVNDTPRDDCIFGNHLCLSAPLQLLREQATIFQNILVNYFITI